MNFYQKNNNYFKLNIKVKAAAKINLIRFFTIYRDKYYLQIYINKQPEKNKANEEILKFLSKSWDIKIDNIEIKSGLTSNYKTLFIKNIDEQYLNFIISNYIPCESNKNY